MNKPNKAAIYCRASADPGAFEPENADSLAFQAGSAMAFLKDHHLDFCGLYVDDKSLSAWEALMRECARGNIDVMVVRDISVISPEYETISALEKSLPTLVIGAEDLYYTNETFNLETFEFERDTQANHQREYSGQNRRGQILRTCSLRIREDRRYAGSKSRNGEDRPGNL